jgi:ribonucleotide reductase alpha subunit
MAILESQIETGMPYIGFKDHINRKSNQKNIGTIKSSNLCIEITEYSDHEEYAVCNLASIALKSFVKPFEENIKEWIIYTKPNCKYCKYSKTFFNNNNIKYTEFNGLDNLDYLKNILSKEQITFPQIFIINNDNNLTSIGGWGDLDKSKSNLTSIGGWSDLDKSKSNITSIGGWSDLYKYYKGTFDFDKLYQVAYLATINLDKVIDINYYPVPQAKKSNMKHRPIGLGIQGLADTLVLMKIPFDSEEAIELNETIMETIYLASMTASNDNAKSRNMGMNKLISYMKDKYYPEYYESNFKLDNLEMNNLYHSLRPNKYELSRPISDSSGSYSTFEGSPFSQGLFQFDLWDKKPTNLEWTNLKEQVKKYGTRNSLLTALMPTASTSQILGNNECFEFFTNNIYTRKTQSGDFMLVNKYLVNDLINIGLWSIDLKNMIIASNGSIQMLDNVPQEIRDIYKTIWEIKQIWVLKAAVARGPFVDQTQSMNIFMGEPDYKRLGSSHIWGWKNGLKTGMYYLRTKPAVDAIKFTINPDLFKQKEESGCENCSA